MGFSHSIGHSLTCGNVVGYSADGSVEESEPSSPTAGPPANFDEVVPGIYRSSFPRLGSFEFLGTLRLKTILYVLDLARFQNVS